MTFTPLPGTYEQVWGCRLTRHSAKPRILIVDDHNGNRIALKSLLGREYVVDIERTTICGAYRDSRPLSEALRSTLSNRLLA